LFEPFVQADKTLDRSKGGLGLGLSLVKSLVERHGGSVSARSEGPGQGAEFSIRLPLSGGSGATRARGTATERRDALRVLIIEDNTDAAVSLKEALELSGHEVEVAYTGPEDLAELERVLVEIAGRASKS
jgi:nitrogen-specific signal transduction histidine kinase